MSNILVRIEWTLDIPEEDLVAMVGRPDDGGPEWYGEAGEQAAAYVEDDLHGALEKYGHAYPPEVTDVT